jgi:acetolactate synthase-1/2/3 large subunit
MIAEVQRAGIRFALTHAEAAAAIMAATYGELTGRPGACLVTRGPGAASAVNGVAHALLDRAPMVILTEGFVHQDRRRVTHQRLDHAALFRSAAKWTVEIGRDGCDELARTALNFALEPCPGPVHLDLVPDAPRCTTTPPSRVLRPSTSRAIFDARNLIAAARSPVVLLGVGARRAAPEVRWALEGLTCPILTTYKAKGVVPESWPSAAGLLTGGTIEAPVLRAADLIVALGVDAVELIPAPWPYEAPVVSLSSWARDDDYFVPAVELVGELAELTPLLEPLSWLPPRVVSPRRWLSAALAALDVGEGSLRPQDVVRVVRNCAPHRSIATVDSGAHMLAAMPYWLVESPEEVLISSGLATMGFALPAAISAALVHPERRVICLVGDGGLSMALGELETVARLNVPVTIVVFNDASLSLIEIKQGAEQGGPEAVRFKGTDFAAIAHGFGISAARARTVRELGDAVTQAVSFAGPFLVDAAVDPRPYRQILAAIRSGAVDVAAELN